MTRILTALILSTLGTVRDEGHCLDQRAFVLTAHEHKSVEDEVTALRSKVGALRHELTASKRETAAALEGQAVCLVTECPPPPICDCSEWQSGFAGMGVGMAVCGAFWAGSAL